MVGAAVHGIEKSFAGTSDGDGACAAIGFVNAAVHLAEAQVARFSVFFDCYCNTATNDAFRVAAAEHAAYSTAVNIGVGFTCTVVVRSGCRIGEGVVPSHVCRRTVGAFAVTAGEHPTDDAAPNLDVGLWYGGCVTATVHVSYLCITTGDVDFGIAVVVVIGNVGCQVAAAIHVFSDDDMV